MMQDFPRVNKYYLSLECSQNNSIPILYLMVEFICYETFIQVDGKRKKFCIAISSFLFFILSKFSARNLMTIIKINFNSLSDDN